MEPVPKSHSKMLSFKDATNSAFKFLSEVQDKMGKNFSDVRLEEIEFSEETSQWLITLGYNLTVPRDEVQEQYGASLFSPPGPPITLKREYKLFKINASTGKVESMKIRKV